MASIYRRLASSAVCAGTAGAQGSVLPLNLRQGNAITTALLTTTIAPSVLGTEYTLDLDDVAIRLE